MRIVHAVATQEFAGVERHIARLAQAQAARGHDVLVLGGHPEQMRRAAAGGSFAVAPVHSLGDLTRTLATVSRTRCDVVNSHLTAADAVAALTVPARVTLVSTRHFGRRRGARPSTRAALAPLMRRVDVDLAVSDYVANHIGGPARVVLTGVPAVTGPPLARARRILVAQRLSAEKRTAVALHAFHQSRLWESGWSLDVAGTGGERAKLQALAVALGISPWVHFLGFAADVPDRMRVASMFLAPRGDEDLGISVLEAMAAGLPVVAAGAAGHLETVGSVTTQWLFPPDDAHAAAQVLRRLAEDEACREAYGNSLQARQRSAFTLERQAEQTDAVYEGIG